MTTPCRKSISDNYRHPPGQAACCMSDILSIRQQQQAHFNMSDIEPNSTTQTEGCQCDLCREGEELEAVTIAVMLLLAEDKTSGVRTLPDETNAALSLPDAETTVPQKKLPEFSFQALKPGGVAIRDSLYDS